jgi:hypothetical protein
VLHIGTGRTSENAAIGTSTIFDTIGHNLSNCGLRSRSDRNTANSAEPKPSPDHHISTILDAGGHNPHRCIPAGSAESVMHKLDSVQQTDHIVDTGGHALSDCGHGAKSRHSTTNPAVSSVHRLRSEHMISTMFDPD